VHRLEPFLLKQWFGECGKYQVPHKAVGTFYWLSSYRWEHWNMLQQIQVMVFWVVSPCTDVGGRQDTPKHWQTTRIPHGITTPMTMTWIFIAVKTKNPCLKENSNLRNGILQLTMKFRDNNWSVSHRHTLNIVTDMQNIRDHISMRRTALRNQCATATLLPCHRWKWECCRILCYYPNRMTG